MAEIAKWRKYANMINAKRTNNVNAKKTAKSDAGQKNGGASDVSILERKEITVQALATEATGKAKKYERTGPQEFVEFPYEEVNIPNIVKACNKHFEKRLTGMSIDVLASERGPSCSKISQLTNLKLVLVHFVMDSSKCSISSQSLSRFPSPPRSVQFSKPISASRNDVASALTPPISVPSSIISHGAKRKLSPPPAKKIPKSLPITAMLKLGKSINATNLLTKLLRFQFS